MDVFGISTAVAPIAQPEDKQGILETEAASESSTRPEESTPFASNRLDANRDLGVPDPEEPSHCATISSQAQFENRQIESFLVQDSGRYRMSQETLPFPLTVLELCTGGGGQALGLEMAGFECVGAIDNDLQSLRNAAKNRPNWQVRHLDIEEISGSEFRGVDLIAAGVPCPPFSIAGKQLGAGDERDLFPQALRIIEEAEPGAVMLENVAGFASAKFSEYRAGLISKT